MKECVDIIKVAAGQSFAMALDSLMQSMESWLTSKKVGIGNLIWSRVYLTDPANQLLPLKKHRLYEEILSRGAFSYVGQPLLDGSKIAVVFAVDLEASTVKEGTPDKMSVKYGDAEVFFQSVRLTDEEADGLTAMQQTELIFARHTEWLHENGMTLRDNCMRTWLYVRDIDCNYADVMKGRNAVFEREGLTADTHYIASTGIEGYMAETKSVIAIDFFSVKHHAPQTPQYLNALGYLNRTNEYGVAFERGVKFSVGGNDKVFISGTASIDKHGECLYIGDVAKQADRLFLNISQLLAAAERGLENMTYMVVYLRDIADAAFVESYLADRFPSVPHLVVEASVCRPQWLIEVECVTN